MSAQAAPAVASGAASLQQPAAAAASSDTAAHSLNSLTASSTPRIALLASFITQQQVQQRYASVESTFLSATAALRQAMEKRDKFKAACNSNPPAIRLPSSMQMQLVKHAKLTAVDGDAAFYQKQIAALQAIESESAAKVYAVLLEAKDKHIAHLQTQANVLPFLLRTLKEYRQFVVAYAADFDSRIGPSESPAAAASDSAAASATSASSASSISLFFPIDDAVNHFDSHLQKRVNELILADVNDRQTRQAAKAQAIVEDSKAQEEVLDGAHTGKTIAMIVQQELRQQLRQLQQQQQRAAKQPRSAPTAAMTAPGSNTHRDNSRSNVRFNSVDSSHSSPKPSSSGHSRPRNPKRAAAESSEQLQITTQGHNRSVSSRKHAGHKANNDSSHSHSKNVRGGDRSQTQHRPSTKQQQPQQQPASSNPQRARGQDKERNSKGPSRPPHSRL
jgi:hypothetical protein